MFSTKFLLRYIKSDLWQSRSRFIFVIISYALGIGVLTALLSLSENFARGIEDQARSLLAADLSISSNQPINPAIFDSVKNEEIETAQEITFASMVYVTKNGSSRLIQVRALRGNFPFYGEQDITPATASADLHDNPNNQALIDLVLARQLNIDLNDELRIGEKTFIVSGIINKFPGETYARTIIAPKIIIPYNSIESTALLQRGSRITYKSYIKVLSPEDLLSIENHFKQLVSTENIEVETLEDRKRQLGRTLDNVTRYLAMISFVALLLGGLGIFSAMKTYINSRLSIAATLRCLGATEAGVIKFYLTQVIIISSISTLCGILFSLILQQFLPTFFANFFPFTIAISTSFSLLLQCTFLGIFLSILISVISLAKLQGRSPLQALRGIESSDEANEETSRKEDKAQNSINSRDTVFKKLLPTSFSIANVSIISILVIIFIFTAFIFKSSLIALYFTAGITTITASLYIITLLIGRIFKSLTPRLRSFEARYAISSLYRPQNETGTIIITLGLATFLIATIYLTKDMLLQQFALSEKGNRPNIVFFDVQPDQLLGLNELLEKEKLPLLQSTPIVTMRLLKINDKTNYQLREDPDIPRWTLRREYRSSYRDHLIESETLEQGEFIPKYNDTGEPVPITVDTSIAEDLKLKLGDLIEFDVQGLPMTTKVVGIRHVDWRRVQTNFFVLFPTGVLEQAPQFYAVMSRTENAEESARIQNLAILKYPNISVIDLNLILETADSVIDRVAFVIQFLALFSIASGLLILAGSVAATRTARLKEFLLLKTIGASRGQLLKTSAIEFLLLGMIATSIGLLFALTVTWALSIYMYESVLIPPWLSLGVIFILLTTLVLIVGTTSIIKQDSGTTREKWIF